MRFVLAADYDDAWSKERESGLDELMSKIIGFGRLKSLVIYLWDSYDSNDIKGRTRKWPTFQFNVANEWNVEEQLVVTVAHHALAGILEREDSN